MRRRLMDIIENIDRATSYLGALSLEDFRKDDMRMDAVERCLQRITEATIKIGSEKMASIAPGFPAYQARAMGNILRHEYDQINAEIVYNTVKSDLPVLRAACEAALARAGDVE
jgi:uncharacterized protein with HEPN domain